MNEADPLPIAEKGPIERKVQWMTIAASVLTAIMYVANNVALIPGYDTAPKWLKAIVTIIVIAGGTFGVGRQAPHTFRDDEQAIRTGVTP